MITDRYLCFSLGAEEFGIPLLTVKEVLGVPEITPIPFAPIHFVGIMNLRGQVISLMDLRSKFGLKMNTTNETAVIICDLGSTSIGIVVDSINSVLNPEAADFGPTPELGENKTKDYITSIYRKDQKMILFLDILKTVSNIDKNLTSNLNSSKNQRKAS